MKRVRSRYRRSLVARQPWRHFRPLFEPLESRQLMAFNLSLSTAVTAGVTIDNSVPSTRVYRATANGANVNFGDISTAMNGGLNVIVDSGSTGTQAGNITSAVDSSYLNAANTSLTIRSGSGTNLVGDITLAGIALNNLTGSSLIIQAARNVTLNSPTSATFTAQVGGTMAITASAGSITMPTTSQLVASALTLTATTGIGAAGAPIFTRVDTLTANTAAGNGSQFITQQSKGLTALNLNAGTGDATLFLFTGSISDTDTATDITAANASVTLNAANQNLGAAANPIRTSVDTLTVQNIGGSQFITEANGLSGLS